MDNSNSTNQGQNPKKTEALETTLSPQWEWQSNEDPWSSEQFQQWTKYSPDQTQIIEVAFQKKEKTVDIGDYLLNLASMQQIHKEKTWKVRPVRRIQRNSRPLRFCSELINPKAVSCVAESGEPEIIEKWLKNRKFNFKIDKQGYNRTDEEEMPQLKEVVRLAMKGIVEEARKGNWGEFAEIVTKRFEESFFDNPRDIFSECIYAYTEENSLDGESLYTVVNKALRDIDESKIETLGPFCYLLQLAVKALSSEGSEVFSAGKVYRGLVLDEDMLEVYKEIWKRGLQVSFHSFVSASKDEAIVKEFLKISGNQRQALLVIESPGGAYVEPMTACDGEHEVLLPAGRVLDIIDIVDKDVIRISLKMVNKKLL